MSTDTPSDAPTGTRTDEPTRTTVAGEAPYDVLIGTGLLGELPGLLGESVQRVLVVHPHALAATGEAVRDDLAAAGFEAYLAEVPDGEDAKRAEVTEVRVEDDMATASVRYKKQTGKVELRKEDGSWKLNDLGGAGG